MDPIPIDGSGQPPDAPTPPKLYAWKFFIPSNPKAAVLLPPQPGDLGEISAFGCGGVAISSSEAGALAALKLYAGYHAMGTRWLEAVRAIRIDLIDGTPLCLFEL